MTHDKGDRMRRAGVAFMVVGAMITMGTVLLNWMSPMAPDGRLGLLAGGTGFVLAGVVMYVLGRMQGEGTVGPRHS